MKLELLLEREPFADVFVETFKSYLISMYGDKIVDELQFVPPPDQHRSKISFY